MTPGARLRAWAFALTLGPWALAQGGGLTLTTDVPASATADLAPSTTPPEDRRPPDQTFLTFPEWFLVYSPAEYAGYLASGAPPSGFPLFAHIAQFWQAYAKVTHEVARFPFNAGYHLMICVIGASTTAEYTLRAIYEHTVGRLAEATATGAAPVPEEAFAAGYAQRYVDFIRVEPWYLFDFGRELKSLWSDTPTSGPDLIRRWERRFALTTELLVKTGYGRLITWATRSIYEAPRPVTAVVLDAMPPRDEATHPDLVVLQPAAGAVLANVPRYQAFTDYARWLADQRVEFREIAGNDGDIVVSLLAPSAWQPEPDVRLLFEQPVLTAPGRKRSVVALPVAQLAALLRAVDRRPVLQVEHIYDY